MLAFALSTADVASAYTLRLTAVGIRPEASQVQTPPAVVKRILTISPAVNGNSTWDLDANGPLVLAAAGVYTLTAQASFTVNTKLWGAGGAGGYVFPGYTTTTGGGGGAATGAIPLIQGGTYTAIVGSPGTGPTGGSIGFGGAGSYGPSGYWGAGGGGLSGIFSGTR